MYYDFISLKKVCVGVCVSVVCEVLCVLNLESGCVRAKKGP